MSLFFSKLQPARFPQFLDSLLAFCLPYEKKGSKIHGSMQLTKKQGLFNCVSVTFCANDRNSHKLAGERG